MKHIQLMKDALACLDEHGFESYPQAIALRQYIKDIESYRAAYPDNFIQPLTVDEILALARDHYNPNQRPEISFARAIETAHGIKGEA